MSTTIGARLDPGRAARRSAFVRYGAAILSTALAVLLRLALDPVLGNRGAYLFFILTVAFSAWYGGYGPAILATLVGLAAVDWYFLPPRYEFPFASPGQAVLTSCYGVSAFLVACIVRALARAPDRLGLEVRGHERALEELRTIAEAGAALAEPLALEEAYERIVRLIVPRIADWCVIDVVEEDAHLRRVAVHHADLTKTSWARSHLLGAVLPSDAPAGAPRVVRTGDEELYSEMSDRALWALGQDSEHVGFLKEMGARAGLIVPLKARGHNVGDLVAVWALSRPVPGPSDLSLIRTLADRAALAIDTMVLYARAQEEAERRKREESKVRVLNVGLEERVRERTKELREALAELESFAYSIAHDLRAPLRAQAGFSDLLLEDYGERVGEGGREHLRQIKGAAQRMDGLVQDLLTFSRLTREEIRLEPVDVERLLSELFGQLEGELRERRAKVSVDGPLPEVLAHRAMLGQILSNLLSNALKFTAPGTEPRVTVRGEERGPFVRIWVEDEGIGISAEYHEKIFGVFERLDPERYPGNGIGLAIVRKGAERMGGRAGVESEPRKGSRFWFDLPRVGGERTTRVRRALSRG